MEGKIKGVPLALILLILGIALLVDVPIVLVNMTTQRLLKQNILGTAVVNQKVSKLLVTPTIEPTATPSATPAAKSLYVPAGLKKG